jgi:hypothetical protein
LKKEDQMTRELKAISLVIEALGEPVPNALHVERMAVNSKTALAVHIVQKLSAAGVFRDPRLVRERL